MSSKNYQSSSTRDFDFYPSSGPLKLKRLSIPPKCAPVSFLDPQKAQKCLVGLLDGSEFTFIVRADCVAQELLNEVCDYLEVNEKEYFGITYQVDNNDSVPEAFLDLKKPLARQLRHVIEKKLEFRVKYYPFDLKLLKDPITKYLIVCQVRLDIVTGRLPLSFQTYCLLGSYNVQADLEDFDLTRHSFPYYLRGMPFAPPNLQSTEMLECIAALHVQHQGMEPEKADNLYLDNARRLALYGVRLYKCKYRKSCEKSYETDTRVGVFLGGFVIYRGAVRVQRFSWPAIVKFSFDSNKFTLRRRPFEGEAGEKDESYLFNSSESANRFFTLMMDHHEFSRMRELQTRSPTLMPPRDLMLSRSESCRQGGGQCVNREVLQEDVFMESASQDWETLKTMPRQPDQRAAQIRFKAFRASMPNISLQDVSASSISLGSDTKTKSHTTDTTAADPMAREKLLDEQQIQEEEERPREKECRHSDEKDLIRQDELEQQRLGEENDRQYQVQAAALGVEPSLVPHLSDLSAGDSIPDSIPIKNELELHGYERVGGPVATEPLSIAATSMADCGSQIGIGENQMCVLPPKETVCCLTSKSPG